MNKNQIVFTKEEFLKKVKLSKEHDIIYFYDILQGGRHSPPTINKRGERSDKLLNILPNEL